MLVSSPYSLTISRKRLIASLTFSRNSLDVSAADATPLTSGRQAECPGSVFFSTVVTLFIKNTGACD
jgi:hypothetical protein